MIFSKTQKCDLRQKLNQFFSFTPFIFLITHITMVVIYIL